ncbi:MAG: patatin-like phospholipase family protein [Gallionella sp.]
MLQLWKSLMGRKVRVRTIVLFAIILLVGAYVAFLWMRATPLYTVRAASQEPECITAAPDADVLVGLAVSGGGSRAALFAAGVLEAMAKLRVGPDHGSMLEEVSYISSVSGGSLASSYFVVKKPTHETPVLTPEGKLTETYRGFFADFKKDMARDYESLLLQHQITSFRPFNPAWTAWTLAEILDEEYLGGLKFEGLARREAQGDSPHLIVNTTLYNNGRRFSLSTLPQNASHYDVLRDLNRLGGNKKLDEEGERMLRTRWDNLLSVTPLDIKVNICPIRVAAAVVGSMSFPPVVGPVSFRVENQDQYWHMGDGGLSDNTGAETLVMTFLKKLQEKKARRAVIFSLDSSFPFSIGGEVLNHRAEGFTFMSYDFSRIPSIMEERATAYRSWFFRMAQREGLLSDQLQVITFRHTDAQWNEDLSDLPDSCRKEDVTWKSREQVNARLAGIATRLWLASPCDRDLILAAADKVVAQNADKIKRLLQPVSR